MSLILGISAYFHDSAAAILVDGKIIAAAQEERFTRIKHDKSFPINAVQFCLDIAEINVDELDAVVFYEKPFQKFERIIDSNLNNIPFGFNSFRKAMKSWFSDKLWIPKNIQKTLNYKGPIKFVEHHQSHAASAFYCSPFEDALVIVVDAVGEKSCTSISKGAGNQISPLIHQEYPHSLGLFYSAFTYYCGFKVNSGEYKLMGLAPYGEPKYCELIKKHFITICEDGTIELNMKNYGFDSDLQMLSAKGISLLKNPVRKPETEMTQYFKDIAASVQVILEEAVIKIVQKGLSIFHTNHIALAGGVALNCVANQKLAEAFPDKQFWIQPASGDAGGAVGAALCYYHDNTSRKPLPDDPSTQVYLGPEFSKETIQETLQSFKANYRELDADELSDTIAEYLLDGKIVGWFQDKMEFGPRALGNRSILASPIPKDMKSRLNFAIKKREGFRPFAPVVLEECANDWFQNIIQSKYMLQTYKARENKKSLIPSCVHEDGTSRVQTVSLKDNEKLHSLICAFNKLSNVPVLINTSFNLRGEPIVCAPEDAINCFIGTDMDVLVLNNFVILKDLNPTLKPSKDVIRILD